MRIISIINQKGGCGKTTSAINLAGITARKGYRTLLVDLDPQSHCAAGLAIPEQRIDLDIGDVMLASPDTHIDPARLFWRASRNLDLAPSRMKLAGLESSRGGLADKPDKERRLANVLSRFARNYDFCFVDCSPSIGLLTFNALAAATDVLIPVETSFFALQGATKQVGTIKSLSKKLGMAAPYWLVATIHDEGSVLACDLLEELRRRFGKRVSPQVIRRDPTLKEAASFGQPVVEYAPTSSGAKDYSALADWLIESVTAPAETRVRVTDIPLAPDAADPPSVEIIGSVESKLSYGRKLVSGDSDSGSSSHDGGSDAIPMPDSDESYRSSSSNPTEPGGSTGAVALADARTVTRHVLTFDVDTTDAVAISRAEDMAQRARVLLLKKADERLRHIINGGAAGADRGAEPALEAPLPPLVRQETARAKADSIRELLGVRHTRSGVLFVQPLSAGLRVSVAGDFNGWSSTSAVLKRNEALGVFELCTPIPPGRYRYRLVVDGRWTADPFNDQSEPNEFNELNSILDIEDTRG